MYVKNTTATFVDTIAQQDSVLTTYYRETTPHAITLGNQLGAAVSAAPVDATDGADAAGDDDLVPAMGIFSGVLFGCLAWAILMTFLLI